MSGDDETHNRLVLEEYKIWKRATPFLYDVVVSHTLEWPVAHAQWLPQRRIEANGVLTQRIALASHRSILLADVRLPSVPVDLADTQYHSAVHAAATEPSVSFTDGDLASTSEGALGRLEIVQRIDAPAPIRCVRANPEAPRLLAARFADGGDSLIYDSNALPPRPPLLAPPPPSSSSAAAAAVKGAASSFSSSASLTASKPLLRLSAHDAGGGALCWAPRRANTLATVANDGRVCIWDVTTAISAVESAPAATASSASATGESPRKVGAAKNATKGSAPAKASASSSSFSSSASAALGGTVVAPLATLRAADVVATSSKSSSSSASSSSSFSSSTPQLPPGTLHCVDWHFRDQHVLVTGGEDRRVRLWDARTAFSANTGSVGGSKPLNAVQVLDGHKAGVLSVSFSPCSDHMLLAASTDKTISLWDRRNTKTKLHSFEYHAGAVLSVTWSPFSESVFASSGADRRVMVWDVRKIGDEQNVEDVEDGPPELLFVHGGHTAPVPACVWAGAHAPWMLATAANNGVLQFWQMQSQLWRQHEAPLQAGDLDG